ncbi:hypothetical protein PIB30_067562, partial [Stylosanthes scabra]|nr:hypothetical protein [Stylosanthes scabra]
MDSAADLVMLKRCEYENKAVRRRITQDILDEWSFSNFNESVASDDSMVKDQSIEMVAMNPQNSRAKQ